MFKLLGVREKNGSNETDWLIPFEFGNISQQEKETAGRMNRFVHCGEVESIFAGQDNTTKQFLISRPLLMLMLADSIG